MSNFLYPGKYVVYQPTLPDGLCWGPALFDHRESQYFLVGETLEEFVTLIQSGTATGDSEPEDLRVFHTDSGELYRLNDDRSGFTLVDPENPVDDRDKEWFKFY